MNYLTQTQTATNTMTAARVRDVMVEVRADFTNVALAGLADYNEWMSSAEDLTHILQHGAAKSFQIQFTAPGHLPWALHYVVSADGTLKASDRAGGVDYYNLPAGTKARLYVEADIQSKNWPVVKEYLAKRGWAFDGQAVKGASTADRVYSADGYGVSRSKVGVWQ